MPLVFADNFLAGAVISLVMPAGLLVAIAVWYHLVARRVPHTQRASTALPPPEVLAAAEEAREPSGPAGPPVTS